MFDLCWVCESCPGSTEESRYCGACGRCYHRLRKRYGNGSQWVGVAREAIACGNRLELLAFLPCPTCGQGRVSPRMGKAGVCQKCRDKSLHLSPEKRRLKMERQQAAEEAKARREAEEREHRRACELRAYEIRRKRNETRIANQRARNLKAAIEGNVTARVDDPYQTALRLARKDPTRVIPVPVGNPMLGKTLYFEPYLDRKGNLQVRQLSDNAKGA